MSQRRGECAGNRTDFVLHARGADLPDRDRESCPYAPPPPSSSSSSSSSESDEEEPLQSASASLLCLPMYIAVSPSWTAALIAFIGCLSAEVSLKLVIGIQACIFTDSHVQRGVSVGRNNSPVRSQAVSITCAAAVDPSGACSC
jgi:hypothetical protein